jgi:transposase-like protein
MRNALAHVGKAQQSMASAALRQAFLQPDQENARQTWRHVADQLRPRWPKLVKLTIGACLDRFTSAECANYLANSGYPWLM